MSDDLILSQVEKDYHKRDNDAGKNIMNATLINKILGNNKKRKVVPMKRGHKVLLPPCIVYTSNAKETILKVPLAFSFDRCFLKPKTTEIRLCDCGKKAKYRKPNTLKPYCSLPCYENLPRKKPKLI